MKSSKSSSPIKHFQRFFKFFDLYGQNVNLLIQKKPKFHTTCSGFMSMGVISLIIFTFTGFITSWMNKEKMTPIPSSISYSVLELLSDNKNYEYELGYENFAMYWSFYSILPNGTEIEIPDLTSYFSYKVTYLDENLNTKELMTEPCRIDQQDKFLGFDQATIDQDAGKVGIYRICIKDNYKMGLFPNTTVATIFQPEIYFSFYQCVNSTNNNNSCVSQESIDEMTKYTILQATVPTTIYDFKNTKKSQKNIYDYHFTKLDKSMNKYYQNQMTVSKLYMDNGLLYDDYQLESTNFNPTINYDPNIRQNNDPLYVFDCIVSFNFQNYYLRNQKINEILGNLGGLINAIFLLGKLLCLAYNSIYLRFKIISTTFSFSQKKGQSEIFPKNAKNMSDSMTDSKIFSTTASKKFSFLSYLFPSKELRLFYQKGAKHLNEYMDIRKIIKRLQDLDKLKIILLTKDQRKLFEYIPKPDVIDSKHLFSLESITHYKNKAKTRNSTKDVVNVIKRVTENNDPINKRILECLDSNIKNGNPENEGFYSIFFLLIEFIQENTRKESVIPSLNRLNPKQTKIEFKKVKLIEMRDLTFFI